VIVTIESVRAGTLTRSQTVFMVKALVLSVVSFILNATMLSPAIRDINAHLGLPVVVTGRIMQGASNISFGLSYLIMRERLTPAVFGVCCGVIAAVNGGVAGTDALLAGYLVDHFGYRSILC
jgi:MFS family permease